MKNRLKDAIHRFTQGRILVVGDLAIDEMVYGHTDRLSREAPVVILRHHRTDIILGAAGNAAHNIASLNAKRTAIVGICGEDYYASFLMEALERDGIESSGVVFDKSRPTTTKTRVSGTANQSVTQQVVRIDRESRTEVSPDIENKLLDNISKLAPEMDALLLSDYGLGVVTDGMIEHCQSLVKRHNLIYAVDSQKALSRFQGATILTPNQVEAEQNLGQPFETWPSWLEGGQSLMSRCDAKNLLITRGQDGMLLFEQEGYYTQIPAFNRSEVFDVTGAGDTVVGTLTLALASGADIVDSSILGNLAASLVVKRFGAAVTNRSELMEALNQLDDNLLATIARHEITSSSCPIAEV